MCIIDILEVGSIFVFHDFFNALCQLLASERQISRVVAILVIFIEDIYFSSKELFSPANVVVLRLRYENIFSTSLVIITKKREKVTGRVIIAVIVTGRVIVLTIIIVSALVVLVTGSKDVITTRLQGVISKWLSHSFSDINIYSYHLSVLW